VLPKRQQEEDIQYVVMKKIGILARANGDVKSATRDPASIPMP
jgi:hypothetical protein